MRNLQADVQQLVDGFVVQVGDLARRAAIETLEVALGGNRPARGQGVRSTVLGEKRSAGDLEKLSDDFVAFVTKKPGIRIEQINKQLGTKTKELALPIRKLVAEGAINTKGSRRSTMYFPGKS